MSSSVTHRVKAVCQDPAGIKTYVYVGRATTDDQGRIAVKIDTLPFNLASWTGWLKLFPVDDDEQF